MSHTLRTLSEMDEATTILSVDGVGAFDLISRNAMSGLDEMLGGLEVSYVLRQSIQVPLGGRALERELHLTGRGGRARRPLMPLLLNLGQHRALVSVAGELRKVEHPFVFHDDLYVMAQPDRVVDIHQTLAVHL